MNNHIGEKQFSPFFCRNVIINKLVLYTYYKKDIGFYLMRYFAFFYFVGTFLFSELDKFFRGNNNMYSTILFVDFLVIVIGLVFLFFDRYEMHIQDF